jgi:GNAT superfamily N-acetyltransferase
MNIREATDSDNEQLLQLQKKSPMGSDLILQLDSSPDFFNRSRGYENWHLLVAEEDGKILGAAGYALQEKPINGEPYSLVYEYGFMVDPDARRMGVASALQSEIENRNPNVDVFHLNITEDNFASNSFFTKQGFTPVRDCGPYMLMAYKELPVDPYRIKQVKEGDIPVVVDLLNETYADYEMFTPFTPESLTELIDRLPFFGISDLILYTHDTVRAVVGFWDYDKIMKFRMLGFNMRWKLMRFFTNFMGKFTEMPKMPGLGEQMTNGYLMFLGYRDKDAAGQVIGHILNQAKSLGVGMVSLPLDKSSHLLEALSGFRYGEGSFKWYMKPNIGHELPALLDKPLYVDPRDV